MIRAVYFNALKTSHQICSLLKRGLFQMFYPLSQKILKSMMHFVVILSIVMAEIAGDIPGCDYFDTVDLTNSEPFENGTYQYLDMLIPIEQIGQYNYQILFEGKLEPVPEHPRGCVCQLKSCVRFCCEPQQLLVEGERICTDKVPDFNALLNVTLHNGTVAEVDVLQEFVVQQFGVPCESHFSLDADSEPDYMWTLYENGQLYRHSDGKNFGKRDYCLQAHKSPNGQFKIMPHQCETPVDRSYAYIQMVSVVFMILTIAVHLYLPEFRAVHNKCCTSFFICLTVSFILLRIEQLFRNADSRWTCYSIAYMGYYFVMATFLWLLIINYNSWKCFREIGSDAVSFKKSNIFVWTIAAVLLLVSGLIDYIMEVAGKDLADLWKPGFCFYSCWIKTEDWSAMIYYHGPMLVLLICNITLSILTAKKLYSDIRSIRAVWSEAESQQKLQNRANFLMFFRFFVIAGVIWLLEVFSYLFDTYYSMTWIDGITAAQGIILFIVTILKKDVLKSIHSRIFQGKGKPTTTAISRKKNNISNTAN